MKVSVIVPVFNPGQHIDHLIETLLGQTLPPAEREIVFVDDGSSDGTGERLDAVAAAHDDVRVIHIPNSGWPGRPRNVGLDTVSGEYVFFCDHDDWLELDALERMYAAALEGQADILLPKMVGHGRRTPALAMKNRHGLDAGNAPLGMLTPHKLFRRALLEENGIRFPEGLQRLEDHLFAIPAFFAAERISVLVSGPVYHWIRRDDNANASHQKPPPDNHFQAIRELSAIVGARAPSDRVRDRYLAHWYRGKVLRRLGSATSHQRDPAFRAEVYAAGRALVQDCFPPRLDARLGFNFRLRAMLVRRDDFAALERFAAFDEHMRARAEVVSAHASDDAVEVEVTGRLRRYGRRAIGIVHQGERMLWHPPDGLEGAWSEDERDLKGKLAERVSLVLHHQQDETEWPVETRTTVRDAAGPDGVTVYPRLIGNARIDPAVAAAGGPLAPGRYDVRIGFSLAGFWAEAPARVDEAPFAIDVSPSGRATPVPSVLRSRKPSRATGLRRARNFGVRVYRALRRRARTRVAGARRRLNRT